MHGQEHIFGGGATSTASTPVGLTLLILAILFILVLPRKYVIVPVLLSLFLIPSINQLYIAGVHWFFPRIIVLCGLLRISLLRASTKKLLVGGFGPIDKAYVGCVVTQAVAFMLLYKQSQATINQVGILIDFLGGYFIARVFIYDKTTIFRALKAVAVVCLILAAGMVIEQMTQQNLFGTIVGGTATSPQVRENKIRSQGSFQHALTAGTFAATLVPLFFVLWKNGKSKFMALLGLASCTVMTYCSNSSTPLLAYVASLAGIALWPIREKMQLVRRGIVIALVFLHMVMKSPVWFLIARVDLTGGSSGYHRAVLVDQFINHFSDWWLIGTKDADTWGWDMWDQQNQFVGIGQTGGLLALGLFIATICRCYSRLGNTRRQVRRTSREWMIWFIGAAMFADLVAFFGINYFDQSRVSWFLLLSIIVAATNMSRIKKRGEQSQESDVAEAPDVVEESESYPQPIPHGTALRFHTDREATGGAA